ncbi:MAG: DUF4823 domain-containing protein [Methylococcales bacterium]|nr:DUF4823 domain-containing protein [Methylococcales bacterium]
MRFFILLLITLIFSGCTATYKQNILSESNRKLNTKTPIIISTPDNALYDGKTYFSSGKTVALSIRSSIARYADNITISTKCSLLYCLQKQPTTESSYYIIPLILHWEDRATEWSGIPDKLEIKISIYNSQNHNKLSSVVLSGKSKWATFGGDHPQDLLPDLLDKYIKSLY